MGMEGQVVAALWFSSFGWFEKPPVSVRLRDEAVASPGRRERHGDGRPVRCVWAQPSSSSRMVNQTTITAPTMSTAQAAGWRIMESKVGQEGSGEAE